MTLFVKFLHVITAMWFIGGLLGRTLTMWQASRTRDVLMVSTLVRLGGYFERWMVIPGSFAVLGFGLVTAWLARWPLLGSLQGIPSNWLLVSTVLYLSMIPLIRFVFLPRGKVFEQALTSALALGSVTSELSAAFRDRVVGAAHVYELATVVLITWLMVAKPF
jgi:uncharacterized membrane protein